MADLFYPANRAAPIAARLLFRTLSGAAVEAEFDWRQEGPQTWDIAVDTERGSLVLSDGGATLTVGRQRTSAPDQEYARLYRRFVQLIAEGGSDVDLAPLGHVADAFLLARRHEVEPFEDRQ